MLRRSLSTGILIALLMSAWVNVLAAAFCPRSAQDHACCYMKQNVHRHEAREKAHRHETHEQMAGMQMQPVVEQKSETDAVSRIGVSCTHCISHSQLPASPATLRDADQSKRNDERATPQLLAAHVLTPCLFVASTLSRQHAPPGATTSARHVLINVFRI
jgi:hypothetical protein